MTAVLEIRPVGPRAVLVEVADHTGALALAQWLRDAGVEHDEVVPAARTVLVDGVVDRARLAQALDAWHGAAATPDEGEPVTVPVVYDGPDLGRVAELWGVTEEEVVRRHTGLELVSAFCGFAPGFSYLAGLPSEWAVPRLATPRERVPAGAVALADTWCGIYPSASPGGWLLLGRTEIAIWDLARPDHPSLLPPGTRVRFEAA